MGTLARRTEMLEYLSLLPRAALAHDADVLHFIAAQKLHGIGIGYMDAHLLISTLLTPGALLWTHDKRLHAAAERLSLQMVAVVKYPNQEGRDPT